MIDPGIIALHVCAYVLACIYILRMHARCVQSIREGAGVPSVKVLCPGRCNTHIDENLDFIDDDVEFWCSNDV